MPDGSNQPGGAGCVDGDVGARLIQEYPMRAASTELALDVIGAAAADDEGVIPRLVEE